MKAIAFVALFTGFYTIDEKYLAGRNTAAALDSFRATVRVINRSSDDFLKHLTR
jgi:hypothetical protein